MGLKQAFAYLVTGAVLFSAYWKQLIGSLVTFNIFSIGVDLVIGLAIWLIGLGYFLSGLWYFIVAGLAIGDRWIQKLLRKSGRH